MLNIKDKYPLIIIGAGPAGLSASVYASRYKIEHLIISESLGGLAFEAHKICNFPTEQEISGIDIITKMQKHAEALGANIIMDKVVNIVKKDNLFKITTQAKKEFLTNTILLSIGNEHRHLNLPDEDKFIGRGVSYCATCDAMFYKDKVVAVIGGSDSANTASLYLSEVAEKVYQIYHRDKLRGDITWIEQIKNNDKIEVIYNTSVVGLDGKEKLEKVILDHPYNNSKELNIDGLFIEIGNVPQKALIEMLSLETDKNNYIKVSNNQRTSQKGIWAAGDITTASNNFHQIITACSEGAIAAENIFNFIQENK